MYEDYFGFNALPFSVTPDPRFFYNNSVYKEAFATLRYGIEERKGFILITGEVGTGKTTLLKIFMRNAEATIHTAFIFNPKLSFTEFIRAIMNDLGIRYDVTEDRLSLLDKLNNYLIEQLKNRQIVALLVDEAQNLSNELLEELRLLSNLETIKDKLLQIVLIGQPELEQKLNQPALRQIKQRIALRCRLVPLKDNEIYQYIDSRLEAVNYDGKQLFDAGAVEKITLYSKGIPRLINMICDNALLITYAASKKKVSAEVIEEVARDLQLKVTAHAQMPVSQSHRSRERDEATLIQEAMPSAWVSRRQTEEFYDHFRDTEPPPPEPQRKSRVAAFGMGMFFGFALAIGMGAVFYSQQMSISDIANRVEAPVGGNSEQLRQTKLSPQDMERNSFEPTTPPSPPTGETSGASENVVESETKQDAGTVAETSESASNKTAARPTEKRSTKENKKEKVRVAAAKRTGETEISTDALPSNEKLEFDVHKAIYNRAIQGVEVSVRDGTVYLSGRVASEKQKLVAALAARNVPGVKSVRDKITVNYGGASRYTDARSSTPG